MQEHPNETYEEVSEQKPQKRSSTLCYFPQSVNTLKIRSNRRSLTDSIYIQWALVDTGKMKQEEAERISKRPTDESKMSLYVFDLQNAYSKKNIPVCPLLFSIITAPSKYAGFKVAKTLSLLIYDTLFGESNLKPHSKYPHRFELITRCKETQAALVKNVEAKLKRMKNDRERKQKLRTDDKLSTLTQEQKAVFELLLKNHPKQANANRALKAFIAVIKNNEQSDDFDISFIKDIHEAWCASANWKVDNLRWVPSLEKWLIENQWKSGPIERRSREKILKDYPKLEKQLNDKARELWRKYASIINEKYRDDFSMFWSDEKGLLPTSNDFWIEGVDDTPEELKALHDEWLQLYFSTMIK